MCLFERGVKSRLVHVRSACAGEIAALLTHILCKMLVRAALRHERQRRARGTEAELTVTEALLSKGICYLSKHAL